MQFSRWLDACAQHGFAQNGLFESKLRFAVCVLIMTPAADAEVGAFGRDACWGNVYDLLGLRGGIAATVFHDADAGFLAGEGEGDKDGFAVEAGEEGAAVNWFLDIDQLGCVGLGRGGLR